MISCVLPKIANAFRCIYTHTDMSDRLWEVGNQPHQSCSDVQASMQNYAA